MTDLIKAEVNVKEIEFLTDTEGIIKKKVKPNFKALGAKMGSKMKQAAAIINQLNQHQISVLEQNGAINIQLDDEEVPVFLSEVEILAEDIPGWSVASKGTLTVALDITVTPELEKEGNARELVNRIQNLRKDNEFELTDRIFVHIMENASLKPSIIQFNDYICREILADSIQWVSNLQDGVSVEINGEMLKLAVTKKG
jgi:isoleucyl-tRNA synthetase